MSGRLNKRWLDIAREDMARVGAVEGDKVDGVKWRRKTPCCDPE